MNYVPRNKKTRRAILLEYKKARLRYNENRRKKYASDPEYRKQVHDRNRNRYREAHDVELRKAIPPKEVITYAKKRKVIFPDDTVKTVLCLDYPEMAQVLGGYHLFVLHRWHRTNRFPRAKCMTVEGRTSKAVYLLDEAKKLVEVMRQHQEQKLYLTVKDSETIAKLFEVMEQPETNEHERANNEKNTQTPC